MICMSIVFIILFLVALAIGFLIEWLLRRTSKDLERTRRDFMSTLPPKPPSCEWCRKRLVVDTRDRCSNCGAPATN